MCRNHKMKQSLPTMEHRMVYMVVLFCFLIHMSVICSDSEVYHVTHRSEALILLLGQAVGYLLYCSP